MLLALCATIPAFYADLLTPGASLVPRLVYAVAALLTAAALLHTARRTDDFAGHLRANVTDLLLAPGLLLAAVLPGSDAAAPWLWFRLAVAFLSLVRMVWAVQRAVTRGGLLYLLLTAAAILVLCGAGYWWIEPTTPTLAEGLWLAFVTAATVGYGDVVPTTTASKIFSIFVVLLGFGVLTLVTAAIAAHWVETEEREIEREVLRDVHRQIDLLRRELAQLRAELTERPPPS